MVNALSRNIKIYSSFISVFMTRFPHFAQVKRKRTDFDKIGKLMRFARGFLFTVV